MFYVHALTRYVQIIPRAIDYFTGKALEFEDFDDDDDDFEDIDEDDEDEDDFEDDVCWYPVPLSHFFSLTTLSPQDSDSDADIPARRRGPPKGRGAGANQNVNPEECKQQ